MKYMLLMQFDDKSVVPLMSTWPLDDVKAHIAFMHDTNQKLLDTGEFVDAQGLGSPEQAKIVRAGAGGSAVVTNGPYPETKEFLAGYWIVDCENEERAIDLAAFVSAAPGPGGKPLNMPIEVREVMSGAPEEL